MMLRADIGLIYRCNEWKLLDAKTQIGQGSVVPVWVETIFTLLDPFVHRFEHSSDILYTNLHRLLINIRLKINIFPAFQKWG